MSISNFYKGTTKKFSVPITLNGSSVDITSDTVVLTIKQRKTDSDDDAVLIKNADVATSGATGIALFIITKVESEVAAGNYYLDIQWQRSNGEEYIVHEQAIEVLSRVSDP